VVLGINNLMKSREEQSSGGQRSYIQRNEQNELHALQYEYQNSQYMQSYYSTYVLS